MNPIITAIGTIAGWNTFAVAKVWTLNFLLQMAFYGGTITGDFTQYRQMVAQGAPCWVQISSANLPTMGLGIQSRIQPACPYDGSNTNPGYMLHAPVVRPGVER